MQFVKVVYSYIFFLITFLYTTLIVKKFRLKLSNTLMPHPPLSWIEKTDIIQLRNFDFSLTSSVSFLFISFQNNPQLK